jgi:prophage antirepressor-like protein
LGYADPNKAIRTHCKAADTYSAEMAGQVRTVKIIPERDIYRLVLKSKLPAAVRLEEWVVGHDANLRHVEIRKAAEHQCTVKTSPGQWAHSEMVKELIEHLITRKRVIKPITSKSGRQYRHFIRCEAVRRPSRC